MNNSGNSGPELANGEVSPAAQVSGEGGAKARSAVVVVTGGVKWFVGIVIAALIGAALSPIYLPRLRNWIAPGGAAVDILVQDVPPCPPQEPAALPASGCAPGGSTQWAERYRLWALPEAVTNTQLTELRSIGPDLDEIGRWVYDHGGADRDTTRIRVIVQGIDQKIVITGVSARVVDRAPVLHGTKFDFEVGGGSATPEFMEIDLDRPSVVPDYFSNRVITVGAEESVVLEVWAGSATSTVTWDLDVQYVVAGEARSTVVTAGGGRHFRTTPTSNDYTAVILGDVDGRYSLVPEEA